MMDQDATAIKCGPPPQVNNSIANCCDHAARSVTYVCSQGYEDMEGSGGVVQSECLNGAWTPPFMDCQVTPAANSSVTCSISGERFRYPFIVTLSLLLLIIALWAMLECHRRRKSASSKSKKGPVKLALTDGVCFYEPGSYVVGEKFNDYEVDDTNRKGMFMLDREAKAGPGKTSSPVVQLSNQGERKGMSAKASTHQAIKPVSKGQTACRTMSDGGARAPKHQTMLQSDYGTSKVEASPLCDTVTNTDSSRPLYENHDVVKHESTYMTMA